MAVALAAIAEAQRLSRNSIAGTLPCDQARGTAYDGLAAFHEEHGWRDSGESDDLLPACDAYKWHGRPFYPSTWMAMPCALTAGAPAAAGDFAITIVVVGDAAAAAASAATWVRRAFGYGAHVSILVPAPLEGDAAVAALRRVAADAGAAVAQLPGAAAVPSAQWPLLALRAAHAAASDAAAAGGRPRRWHALLTEHTWFSVEEAAASVGWYNSALPLLMGHVDAGRVSTGVSVYGDCNTEPLLSGAFATWPVGSAGVLLSAAALTALSSAVLSSACPWPAAAEVVAQRWDVALGRCALAAGVPQMHSTSMYPTLDSELGQAWHFDNTPTVLEDAIAVGVSPLHQYTYLWDGSQQNDTMYTLDAALAPKYALAIPPAGAAAGAHAPHLPSAERCGASGRAAAAAAVAAWAAHARFPPPDDGADVEANTMTLTRASLYALHACVRVPPAERDRRTSPADFAYVVMGSSALRPRLVTLQARWGAWATAAGAAVYYFSDAGDAELNTTVLTDCAMCANTTKDDAQHRSLRGLQHALVHAPDARWFYLVDDDTDVDVEEAAAAVADIDPSVPIVAGFVVRARTRWSDVHTAFVSGGAGMLLSASAARAIGAALYTPACNFTRQNDISIAMCAYELGIPMVHLGGWNRYADLDVKDADCRQSVSEYVGAVSHHNIWTQVGLVWWFRNADAVARYKRPAPGEAFCWDPHSAVFKDPPPAPRCPVTAAGAQLMQSSFASLKIGKIAKLTK